MLPVPGRVTRAALEPRNKVWFVELADPANLANEAAITAVRNQGS
jgi:hypothetical protein